MELRCLCKCLLKHLIVRRFLRESGREVQTNDPENARLVLYRSMRGRGGIKLLEPYQLEDLVKRTNILGSLSIAYFKHHYSFIVLQLFR